MENRLVLNMKPSLRKIIDRFALTSLACVLLISIVGCTGPAQHPDPLAGWDRDFYSGPSEQSIEKDYQDYLQALPSRDKGFIGSVVFYKDTTGQHAVDVKLGVNGTWWDHILFYTKDNIRIRVIIHKNGGYRS